MEKLIITTVFLLSLGNLLAQPLTSRTGEEITMVQVNSVADIINCTKASTVLHVKDHLRGGTFDLYTGSEQIDNGMVFVDALGRKWKRRTTNNNINIQWYGAISTTNGRNNDAYTAIIAARDYIYDHDGLTLFIPVTQDGTREYFVSKKLSFLKNINISGDASHSGNPLSILRFPSNVSAIEVLAITPNVNFSSIKNLTLFSTRPLTPDTLKHGIILNGVMNMENVLVRYFSGDGIHVDACAFGKGDAFGNSDRSKFTNVEADYNYKNGFYFDGCDANIMLITNCSAQANIRWGFSDNGFLGNHYINCHTAVNGDSAIVTYGNIKYAAISLNYARGLRSSINLNKQPDINPLFWAVIAKGSQIYPKWTPGKRYYSGGAYLSTDINALTIYDGCYSEEGQPASIVSQRALILGGQGAGISGGGFLAADVNQLVARSPISLTTGKGDLYFTDPANRSGNVYFINRDHASNQLKIGYGGSVTTSPSLILDSSGNVAIGFANGSPQVFFERYQQIPSNVAGALFFAPNDGSSIAGRILIGDGTGWSLPISKKTLGTITDLFTFHDNGTMEIKSGQLAADDSSKNVPTTGWIKQRLAVGFSMRSKDYKLTAADNIIASNAPITITLPSAVNITGKTYTIKSLSQGVTLLRTTSGQLIDGSPSYNLAGKYKYITTISDGTGWLIIANN